MRKPAPHPALIWGQISQRGQHKLHGPSAIMTATYTATSTNAFQQVLIIDARRFVTYDESDREWRRLIQNTMDRGHSRAYDKFLATHGVLQIRVWLKLLTDSHNGAVRARHHSMLFRSIQSDFLIRSRKRRRVLSTSRSRVCTHWLRLAITSIQAPSCCRNRRRTPEWMRPQLQYVIAEDGLNIGASPRNRAKTAPYSAWVLLVINAYRTERFSRRMVQIWWRADRRERQQPWTSRQNTLAASTALAIREHQSGSSNMKQISTLLSCRELMLISCYHG